MSDFGNISLMILDRLVTFDEAEEIYIYLKMIFEKEKEIVEVPVPQPSPIFPQNPWITPNTQPSNPWESPYKITCKSDVEVLDGVKLQSW